VVNAPVENARPRRPARSLSWQDDELQQAERREARQTGSKARSKLHKHWQVWPAVAMCALMVRRSIQWEASTTAQVQAEEKANTAHPHRLQQRTRADGPQPHRFGRATPGGPSSQCRARNVHAEAE
jgi:hypothetical protein